MKRHWKIVVGVFCIIGGIGNLRESMGAALLGLIAGAALIAWWYLPSRKEASAAPIAPIAPGPNPSIISKKEAISIPIPKKIDGCTIAYRYTIPLTDVNKDAVANAVLTKTWALTAEMKNGHAYMVSNGSCIGALTRCSDMMGDWLKRGDPYLAMLKEVKPGGEECSVFLVFYRNKLLQNEYREKTVTALTAYSSKTKQEIIYELDPDDELEAEEDDEHEGKVVVTYIGEPIGNLPSKQAKRFLEEGAALIVLDHKEEEPDKEDDEGNIPEKPFVRIYW